MIDGGTLCHNHRETFYKQRVMSSFRTTEAHLSQIPAMQLLANLGYQLLTPQQALQERGGKLGNVLLEGILHQQLAKLNQIHYRGEDHRFSEANIQEAIQKLKNVQYDGLLRTNQEIYDLLTLGTTLEQTINSNSRSFNLIYIDWRNPANNVFHLVPEFSVERTRSEATARPDLVLFVNGIPLAVIECKAPGVEVEQAVSQSIRNQGEDYIPRLFTYAQLVMAVNKNAAMYATAGTKAKFWSVWKEREDQESDIATAINTQLSKEQKDLLFSGDFASNRKFFDELESKGDRQITEQDRALHSLCRPERLLDLAYRFTLFESGEKKIARYQQFFVVRSTLDRVKRIDEEGKRSGGVIWHTQGSGKSLTMVMLARALALDPEIKDPRIVLVTDREDLDEQLGNTFAACDLSRERATSGRNLVTHLKNKVGIITTLIHKFEKAWLAKQFVDESPDIFVLADESHRTHYGPLSARMRQILPNSCYIGFTGTPLTREEKNNFVRFGGLIEPHYSIRQAVEDGAVLPLLYEGRYADMQQDKAAIDIWFERHTSGLSESQKADLKRKYARAEELNQADRVIYMRAFDICEHYRANWQGTGFKAQLVTPSKAAAMRYHQHLKDFGHVTSEVVISGPDTRDDHEEVDAGPTEDVGKFWKQMMNRFGSEKEYNKQIINQFKHNDEPEILIVVDKLLTGFDAPRNTVLYLCRTLTEHTLLQAIARVNRLFEGKEFGYIIDYNSVLGEIDRALNMYDELAGFSEDDLAGTLTSINEEVKNLPQKHSNLWDLFKSIKNEHDEEAYETLLADDALRDEFYERLTEYSKALAMALSTDKFLRETDERLIDTYKGDLKRFQNLRAAVKLRYAEAIDYRDYQPKIKKLLDTHIRADEVIQLNAPVNIYDQKSVDAIMEDHPQYGGPRTDAAKADAIAHATKREISEKIDEDPAFYEKFSKLIQQAIDDFRAGRMAAADYLASVKDIQERLVSNHHDDVPETIRNNSEASAYYGASQNLFADWQMEVGEALICELALAVQDALAQERIVDFWHNEQAQNKVKGRIDDFFYDVLKAEHDIDISTEQMDAVIERVMQIARSRSQR